MSHTLTPGVESVLDGVNRDGISYIHAARPRIARHSRVDVLRTTEALRRGLHGHEILGSQQSINPLLIPGPGGRALDSIPITVGGDNKVDSAAKAGSALCIEMALEDDLIPIILSTKFGKVRKQVRDLSAETIDAESLHAPGKEITDVLCLDVP